MTKILIVHASNSPDDASLAQRIARTWDKREFDVAVLASDSPVEESVNKLTHIVLLLHPDLFVQFVSVQVMYDAIERLKKKKIQILPVQSRTSPIKSLDEFKTHLAIVPESEKRELREIFPAKTEKSLAEHLQAMNTVFGSIQRFSFSTFWDTRLDSDFDDELRRIERAILNPIDTPLAFLSYARKDGDIPVTIKDLLEAREIDIWYDKANIAGGKAWKEQIYQGIENSHNFFCVVSPNWLMSFVSNEEYNHAKSLNKRIIALILTSFDPNTDEQILRDHPKMKEWTDKGVLEEDVIQTVTQVWHEVSSLPHEQTIAVSQSELRQTIDDIQRTVRNPYEAYINQHTQYLISAKGTNREEDTRIWNPVSLLRAFIWAYRNRQSPYPPASVHINYFRRSLIGQLLVFVVGISIVLAGITTIQQSLIRTAQAEAEVQDQLRINAENEAEAQRQISAEANARVQSLAQLNNTQSYNLSATGQSFTIADNRLWIAQSDNLVTTISGNGLSRNTISVDEAPDQIVEAHGYLWVNHTSSPTLRRIDPQTDESIAIPVGSGAYSPLVTEDAIWVTDSISGTLIRIDPDMPTPPETFFIGLNIDTIFATPDAIWYVTSDDTTLVRLTNFDEQRITLPSDTRQAVYDNVSNQIIAFTDTSIHFLDTASRQFSASAPLSIPLSQITATQGYLWGIRQDTSGFLLVNLVDNTLYDIELSGAQEIYVTPDAMWAIGDTLALYDPVDVTLLAILTDIPDAQQLSAPISDGQHAWFVDVDRNTVYIVNQRTGALMRDLQPCGGLTRPIFDGMNMWFNCRDDNTVLQMPARLQYFGEQTQSVDTGLEDVTVTNGIAWMPQISTGRIIVYDMAEQRQIDVLDFGTRIVSPATDGTFIWSVTATTGTIIRIDTTQVQSGMPPQQLMDTIVTQVRTNRPTDTVDIYGDYVWLRHVTTGNSDGITATIVDSNQFTADTLITTSDAMHLGPATLHNGELWLSMFDLERSYIAIADPATGEIYERFPTPDTTFASGAPKLWNDLLWFTATLPSTFDIVPVMIGTSTDTSELGLPYRLVAIDPVTRETIYSHDLSRWLLWPRFNDNVVWYGYAISASDISNSEQIAPTRITENGDGLITLDYQSGEVINEYYICGEHADLFVVNDYAWQGCWNGFSDFAILQANDPEPIQTYTDIGQYPNPPLVTDEYVIFTFNHDGRMAVFDIETGHLVSTFYVGSAPLSPFVYEDTVYIYNAGSDTLIEYDLN